MAETTIEEVKPKKKEALFSKKNRRILTDPLDGDNPITVQVLGICSALAVTAQLKPSLVMSIAVIFVMVGSSVLTSLLRNTIPSRIRIVVQLAIIATFVILVNELLLAFVYDTAKDLGAFVGLIITNCIVMGRLEAFAMANKPWPSFLDALGNAMGYAIILLLVAFFRELLGSGTLFGLKVFPESLATNGLMLYSSGACIVVGVLIWAQRSFNGYREDA
ncbi:NADH:ubiquinone reductase (Na(+)-transporting) subunit D [Microscilla marina]|uniref:Na(+)-translocating NADH-quinone reductase subunit D n=1 Tax=Microscilla marina ATCC 23134 TaxID=313606 RepID=A1ZH17_MICM2|nr:NADH:ubiquinone reductase (Na(+)-transporting) subunit D [Microscilla marina]EAY30286.1 NADH:ubiquinone oxidoreductase, na(+)-translocating, d subunit [Microscilla marina ATCC 23134]